MSKSDDSLKLNLDVEIKAHKPSMEEIQGYVQAQHKALEAGSNLTLNDYIKESVYKGLNAVVVADLSDMKFDRPYKDGKAEVDLLDLKGVDFSGSVIKNTSFENCNLENAVFCDTDLNNAKFEKNNTLKNLDLRGADLATCQFDDSYKDYGSYGQSYSQKIDGIKFSTTSELGRQYADIKAPAFHKKENQDIDQQAKDKVKSTYDLEYKNMSFAQVGYVKTGFTTGNVNYDTAVDNLKTLTALKKAVESTYEKSNEREKAEKDLKDFRDKISGKDYVMDKSFQNVFGSQADKFDPAYARGSSKAERDQPREYVRLSREDVVGYLDRIKNEPKLSLNDFAKEKFEQEAKKIEEHNKSHPDDKRTEKKLDPNAKYIADCSSHHQELDNSIKKLDLSGLNFSKAKMDGVSFAGSNLQGCNFTDADISRSSFEGADLGKKTSLEQGITTEQSVIFNHTTARDANFFNADLKSASIENSDFKRTFMPRSNATGAKIKDTDFDYANIKNGKWDKTQVDKATFNFANLEGISLAGADLRRVQAQHAILNNAIMDNCKVIESDFSNALMKDVQATKAKFHDTLLNDIKAPGINLTESELTGFTQLKGADLEKAILEHVKAEQISFENANLDKVNAKFADFTGANLEGVKARFADLDNAVLDKAQASKIDMTGAKLNDAKARGADFTKAIMEGVEGQKADLTGAILEGANLRSANLKAAILAKVKMEQAEVDANTNFAKADIKGATGNLKEFNSEGKVTNEKKSIEEHTKQSNEMDKEKNNPWYKRGVAGTLVGGVAKAGAAVVDKVREVGKKVSDFMEAKLGSKWGKILGAVVGAVVLGAVAVTAVMTGGLSLAVGAAVVGGAALLGAAAGAGVGHVVGKKIGVGTAIATGAGMYMGLPPGVALATGVVVDAGLETLTGKNLGQNMNSAGLMAGVLVAAGTGGLGLPALLAGAGAGKAIDLAVEKLTGKTIGALGDKALETVSARLNEVAENCAIDPRAKEWIQEQTKCQAVSKEKLQKLEQSIDNAPKIDQAQNYALQNNLAKQTERVESLDTKMGSLDQKLEQAKKEQQAYLEKQQTTKDVDKAQTKDVQTGKTVEKEQTKEVPKSLEGVSKELTSIKKDLKESQQAKHDAPPTKDTKLKGPKPADKGASIG